MADDKRPEDGDATLIGDERARVVSRSPPVQRPQDSDRAATELQEAPSGPALSSESVLVELDTSGKVGSAANVSLRRLAGDESLPEATGTGRQRYQVLKTLGEGGMGKVHLVADLDLKRRVAMKVMRAEARVHVRRFLEETQILGQLEHPNIVPLYDMDLTGDKEPYCTMRYLRGRTLARSRS